MRYGAIVLVESGQGEILDVRLLVGERRLFGEKRRPEWSIRRESEKNTRVRIILIFRSH